MKMWTKGSRTWWRNPQNQLTRANRSSLTLDWHLGNLHRNKSYPMNARDNGVNGQYADLSLLLHANYLFANRIFTTLMSTTWIRKSLFRQNCKYRHLLLNSKTWISWNKIFTQLPCDFGKLLNLIVFGFNICKMKAISWARWNILLISTESSVKRIMNLRLALVT